MFRKAVASVSASESYFLLFSWILLLGSLVAGSAYFLYAMRMEFVGISRDAESEIRQKLYTKFQKQSSAFFDRHKIGGLMSRLTNDLNAVRDVMGPGIMYPTYFVSLVIPAFSALFYINKPMALLAFLPIIILPCLMLILRRTTFHHSVKVQEMLSEMSTFAQVHYSGIRVVKGYGEEKALEKTFKKICQRYFYTNFRLEMIKGLFYPLLTMITRGTTISLVLLMGISTYRGWALMATSDFVSFMWIQSYVLLPVLMLGWVLPIYIHGSAAYRRLVSVYYEEVEVKDPSSGIQSIPVHAPIQFTSLTFSYPNISQHVLKEINLQIPSGQFIGITGPVGAGKSTLLKLLCRDYFVKAGMINIGEHDISDYTLEGIRNHFVYLEQHPFLFSTTIRENLLFGNPQATYDQLCNAAEQADFLKTILSFPQGFDTMIGERGVTLSGGQKQRLALARAFLAERPVILLDDVFSAVDAETEMHIFDSIQKMYRGKTVVIITHRASILEQMDRIIYMMQGEIVEDGHPEELKRMGEHYAALIELQQLEGAGS
ncbi:MAG: ABC transporter ATP-binding protein [Chlamydiales bacterium]